MAPRDETGAFGTACPLCRPVRSYLRQPSTPISLMLSRYISVGFLSDVGQVNRYRTE
jgi:hypothetical protein